MQNSSVLCSSNSLSPSLSLSTPHRFPPPLQNRCATAAVAYSSGRLPSCFWQIRQSITTLLHSTATLEIVETSKAERGFVEVGYISSVQGLQGEVRVKSTSDFPELRFAKPGRRWLRQEVLGREAIREVELLQGRAHPGKKSWTVKFKTINTVDQAQLLIGSTILVSEEDKPELEEGEFYSNDLLGMRVILKETAEPVGTVVNIVNTGANDVLQVMLNSSTAERSESEASASGPLVWVPFVEAIVPNVDLNKREMLITPPKGLLDLNIRTDERSKKERRQIEWKERKKFQKRLIAAKKKLCEMEQQHVFHGFRHGERSQTSTLADQIVNVNSKLLHQALQNLDVPSSKRWNFHEFMESNLAKDARSTLRISETCLSNSGRGEKVNSNSKLQEKGHLLASEGKVATVLYVDDCQRKGSSFSPDLLDKSENSSNLLVESFFHDNQRLKTKERDSMPLILVCPAHEIQPLQNAFESNNYFGFDSTKVSFLEEEKLPVVRTSPEEQSKYKILMKSPWEILQKPVGSGGVISLLSSNNILDNLTEIGVEYIQVCRVGQQSIGGHTMLGLVSSCEANIGIQSCKGINGLEDNFDMVFSMTFMKHLIKNMNKLPFDAIPKAYPHVEKVENEWVDIVPSDANSYELRCSIYGSLNLCPPDKVCLMEVTE